MTNTKPIRALTAEGIRVLHGVNKADRSLLGGHHNAIRQYLSTGDSRTLKPFANVSIQGHRLETRLARLDWWGQTGELSYESIYGEVD